VDLTIFLHRVSPSGFGIEKIVLTINSREL
jgi:hypothetical protein